MKKIIIIPARYHSTRFPGKPLVNIKGKSLIHRTWSLAKQIRSVDEVYIATDNTEIQKHADHFGANVIMTGDYKNGTERVHAAAQFLALADEDQIINLQGDAVLTPPWVIQALADQTSDTDTTVMSTLAVAITPEQYDAMQLTKKQGIIGGTTVVFDKQQKALYFSKAILPFIRNKSDRHLPMYRHIGLYAYSFATLKLYTSLAETNLEKAEGLEQLRALENGIPVQVIIVDYQGRSHGSVDSPGDLSEIESIIEKQGELIGLT